jgi:hypothetical protein
MWSVLAKGVWWAQKPATTNPQTIPISDNGVAKRRLRRILRIIQCRSDFCRSDLPDRVHLPH